MSKPCYGSQADKQQEHAAARFRDRNENGFTGDRVAVEMEGDSTGRLREEPDVIGPDVIVIQSGRNRHRVLPPEGKTELLYAFRQRARNVEVKKAQWVGIPVHMQAPSFGLRSTIVVAGGPGQKSIAPIDRDISPGIGGVVESDQQGVGVNGKQAQQHETSKGFHRRAKGILCAMSQTLGFRLSTVGMLYKQPLLTAPICKHSRHFLVLLFTLAFAPFLRADDSFPLARRTGLNASLWTNAGVQNGHRILVTTIYTNIQVRSITVAQLNAVIQNCPSNQVVQLTNGGFSGLATASLIAMTKDGVVLRGMTNAQGHPITYLTNAVFKDNVAAWYPSGPSAGWPTKTVRSVTGGLTEGSTSITVSSPPNADFAPGDVFLLDQTFDGTTVTEDTQDDTYTRNTRPYCQALYIVATNATTITFSPPLLGTYWDAATRTPEAVGWSSQLGRTTKRMGIEDIDIPSDNGSQSYTLRLGPSFESWVYNCRILVDTAGAIRWHLPVNCAATANTFHDSTGTGSGTYALLPGPSRDCRWENNISTNVSLFMPCHSSVGDVYFGNYASPPFPYTTSTWLAEQFFPHGGHSHHTIWEGNHISNVYIDDVFSNNNSDLGIVRNRLMGWAPTKTGNTLCVSIGESDGGTGNHRNVTVIGNVLGENSYHGTYASLWHIEGAMTGVIRTNNFNVVNDIVPASEEMVVGNTMLDSYVYAGKPSWFGNRPWPAYGPTIAYTNVLGYTNIPAGYRSYFGEWPAAEGAARTTISGPVTIGGPVTFQ